MMNFIAEIMNQVNEINQLSYCKNITFAKRCEDDDEKTETWDISVYFAEGESKYTDSMSFDIWKEMEEHDDNQGVIKELQKIRNNADKLFA